MGPFDKEKAWSDFRVGLTTFLALFFVILGISFAGGDKGLLFSPTTDLTAQLVDVGGLKKGAPVTMGGMTVGKVTNITFTQDPTQSTIRVLMKIRSDCRMRIKTDSLPSVKTQGMMGDRYVEITPGGAGAGILPEGEILVGTEASEFDATLREAEAVLAETRKLLKAVNEQRGSVGQFFYDEEFYRTLLSVSQELDALIKDFKKHPRRYIKFSIF